MKSNIDSRRARPVVVAFMHLTVRHSTRLRFPVACVASLAILLASGGSAASAHHPGATGDGRIPGKPDFERVGEQIHRYDATTRSYLIQRRAGAPPMRGHLDEPVGANAGPGTALPLNEAAPFCATTGHRIVPVWSHDPGVGSPETLDVIRTIVRRMNWKLMEEASRSSGGARVTKMVVDCNGSGQIRVHDVPSGGPGQTSVPTAVEAALGTPSGPHAVKYLVFRPDCGYSSIGFGYTGSSSNQRYWLKSSSDDPGSGNLNRVNTTTAVVYGDSNCQPVYRIWPTHVSLHEMFHTMGATQYSSAGPAPFATPGSHCTDGLDMLCYDDGTLGGYSETRCPANGFYETPGGTPIDCGYDTYFDTHTESGEWLGTRWNTGGEENPFLATSPPVPPSPARTGFADFTGEGRADAVAVYTNAGLTVRRSTGSVFSSTESWTGTMPFIGTDGNFFADVTGDRRADAIVVNNLTGVTVRRSTGSGFAPNENWTGGTSFIGTDGNFFADVTGDRRADAIVVNDPGGVTVRRSTGSGFAPNENWTGGMTFLGTDGNFFADVTGDGRADAIVVNDPGGVTVRRSTGSGFAPNENWTSGLAFTGTDGNYFADVTGDDMADAIVVNDPTGITVRRSTGSSFAPNENWTGGTAFVGDIGSYFADVTDDGKDDAIVVNRDRITIRRSTGSVFSPNETWTTDPFHGG
jgi:FG-GAP-like repeat